MDEDRTYLTGEDPASPGENPAPAAEDPASPGENPAPAAQAPSEEPVTEERPALEETAIVPAGQPWEEKRGQRGEDLQGQEPAGYRPGDNPMAMASMVCGILSIVFCCGSWISWILSIVAIVLGAVSISKGRRGKGMAMAGIITGAVGIVLSILILIVAGIMGAAGDLAEYSHYFDYYY